MAGATHYDADRLATLRFGGSGLDLGGGCWLIGGPSALATWTGALGRGADGCNSSL